MRLGWILLAIALFTMTVPGPGMAQQAPSPADGEPNVVVGVPDTGINPYHEQFYRPDLTEHPCTYRAKFPCDVKKLNLSIELAQAQGYQNAVHEDQDVWDSISPGTWYWIPKTSFVAAYCEPPSQAVNADESDTCILDDGTDHGTATTSTVLSENPEALIAFKQRGPGIQPFLDGGIPVDVFSVSWGNIAPVPLPQNVEGLYVKSAGNDPRSTMMDGWAANPKVISVGGAYKDTSSQFGQQYSSGKEEAMAAKQPDVVGPYCTRAAQAGSAFVSDDYCGTSFSAPTVAGGLSKVILELRKHSGYPGPTVNGLVDAELGITIHELREAMNRTATYEPSNREEVGLTGIPVNPVAPWLQWGWGFYDGIAADDTIDHFLENPHPPKSQLARDYMHTVYAMRQIYGTGEPTYQPDARFNAFCNGLECTFDASDSSDEQVDDEDLTYSWDLGDGSTASGQKVQHTYAEDGSYDVVLEVSDGSLSDTARETVTAFQEVKLTAAPTKSTYGVDETVEIELTVESTETGEGVGDVPIVVETTYESGNSLADTFFGAPIVANSLRTADVLDHRVTVTTDDNGQAIATIPGEADESGQRVNVPTGEGEYTFRADVDIEGVFVTDVGTYTVEALPS